MSLFTRPVRNIEGYGTGTIGLTVCALLMAAWGCWSSFAEVKLHAVSTDARLEVDQPVASLHAPESGRVVRSFVTPGKRVKAGDALLEIESAGRAHAKAEASRVIVRAPVDGRIEEAANLRAGEYLERGEKVCAVVPDGAIAVVAEFPPAAVMGRIKPGQPAQVRVEGSSWQGFSSVPAQVRRVALDESEGSVRVELALALEQSPAIRAPGSPPRAVEVEIETITPYRLMMRAAGKWMAAERTP